MFALLQFGAKTYAEAHHRKANPNSDYLYAPLSVSAFLSNVVSNVQLAYLKQLET